MSSESSPRRTTNVLSHWYTYIEGVHFSALEFYRVIEDELIAKKLPRLHASRVEFHEESLVSDKRIYLRLARERYAFDICAAPFGTGYFFSYRLIEKPRSWPRLFLIMLLMCTVYFAASRIGGSQMDGIVWFSIFMGVCFMVIILPSAGKSTPQQSSVKKQGSSAEMDIDAFLLNTALLGTLYEQARSDTYFRQDTRLLFQTLLADLVKRHAEAITSAKGVKLVSTYEYSPILGGSYKPVVRELEPAQVEAPAHAVG